MKSLRKMLALLLCLSLFAGLVPAAWAEGEITFDNESLITEETFDSYATDVFPDSLGLTQQTSYTCTLASAAMMLRGRMFRSNNNKWSSVTESSIKPVAWDVYGSLGYSWTYSIDGNSMTVSHRECSGFSVSSLKSLLDAHPEGIVLYDRAVPHAVFVCDYQGDTFYCFDPASSSYSGRRTLSNSWLATRVGNQASILSGADDYWYVSSYSITPTSIPYPSKPYFIGAIGGTYMVGETVSFSWNATTNTTCYRMYFYKENSSGEYKFYLFGPDIQQRSDSMVFDEPGRYKAMVRAYNENYLLSNNTYAYTDSDLEAFEIKPFNKTGIWGNLTWTLDGNGKLSISGSGTMSDFESSSSTNAWRAYKNQITSVQISSGITSIGVCAFDGCGSLTSISIPSTVTSIGNAAFLNCTSLSTISIPNSVTNIGTGVFCGCVRLTSIVLPDNLTSIGDMTFRECGNLNNIYIPASVKSIGNYAFYLCTNLATVNYGGTRTQWSDINVASNNSQLTNATINYNGEIASGTWGNLTWELEKSGMLIISGSGEMDFPWDGVTYPWRHYKDQVIQVWIRSNVTSIGHHAFVGYPNLQTVAISMPSSLTTIGQYAFSNCNSMTSISGIQNVTNIGKAAFSGSGLTYFIIPENMSSIDEEVFADCRNLSSVSIPASITSIGTNAFSDCSSLTDIYYGDVPNKWRTIEVGSNNSSFLNATIHYGGAFDDYSSGPWGNLSWEAADGSNGLAYVMISGSGAMNDFSSDAAVAWRTDTLKNNVTDVDIESNITSIGNYAFMDFRNLRDIYHWKNIQSIGTGAFHGCVNLTEITLPDTVTIIKTGAFYGCTSLSEITIPAGVTMIQTMAFVKCENLRDVYYGGTQSQWNAINIGGANDPLLNATIHYQEPITYAITYNANGGTGAPSNQTKTHDIALTLSSTKPTRANSSAGSYTVTLNANDGIVSPTSLSAARTTSYTFKDWNTSANGSGTSYASGASYTANADVTLYAQWNSNTTTSAVTLPTPTRSGYTFKGWGTSSTANSGVTGSYTPSGNVTLYAIWSQVNHTVTYNANGGTGVPETQIKVVGTDLILSSVIPERTEQTESYLVTLNANGGRVSPQRVSAMKVTSYSFDGWNTAKDGSGTAYVPGEVYKTEADLNLYAQWNVTEENAEASLPTPNRDGYIFRGWAESADATEGVTGYYMPEKNVTLYAIWDIKTFTISYNANGGTDAPDAQSKTPGVALTLTTAIPKYEGCLFFGWAESADATTAAYQPGGSFTKDADTTLYAVWLKPDFVLPDALTEIGEEAFANCGFTYVKLPENTDTIGKNAFANCPNLKYIYIPKNCLWIDRYAFTGVTGLTILGVDGSYAQTYASGKGYDFIAVP